MSGKVAVFGAGSWGTAFSIVLADAGNDVMIWARRDELATAINDEHENTDYLPGIQLPPPVTATHDAEQALHGADIVVLAVPSQTLRGNLIEWAAVIAPDAVMVSLMKGVELGTLERMSEVIAEVTGAGPERIAVVSGPNLAKEIARREPAASVVACADEVGRQDAAGSAATRRRSGRTPAPTCSAASSAAPTRTSSPSRSAWPSGSASATTPRPPSSPAGWPRPPGSPWRSAPTR